MEFQGCWKHHKLKGRKIENDQKIKVFIWIISMSCINMQHSWLHLSGICEIVRCGRVVSSSAAIYFYCQTCMGMRIDGGSTSPSRRLRVIWNWDGPVCKFWPWNTRFKFFRNKSHSSASPLLKKGMTKLCVTDSAAVGSLRSLSVK